MIRVINDMVKGIGCDIVSVSRIKRLLANNKFLPKVCTDYEQSYCKDRTPQTVAGVWAAKEAVSKLLGTGFCGFTPKDIEIRHNEDGKPQIVLCNGAKTKAELLNIVIIHISISHEAEQALAFAVAE